LSAAWRRVRHLRVRAPDGGAARRVAVQLESGLRTATLPSARGVLVVRRLDLGSVVEGASAQTLALLVERKLRELERSALRFDAPGAERAAALRIPDRLAALAVLIERIERDGHAPEWLWRALLPAAALPPARAAAARRVLAEILSEPEGTRAAVELIGRLVARGAEEGLLESLQESDGPLLLARPEWGGRSILGVRRETAPGAASRAPVPPVSARWRAVLARAVARWTPEDARSVWLAAVALADARPGALESPTLLEHAAALVHGLGAAALRARVERPPREPPLGAASPRSSAQPAVEPPLPLLAEPVAPRPETAAAQPSRPHAQAASESLEELAPSALGGLFFAIRALRQLGFEPFLDAHPLTWDVELGRRVLLGLALRSDAALDDAMLVPLLRESDPEDPAELLWERQPLGFALPSEVRERLALQPLRVATRVGDASAEVLADAAGWVVAVDRPLAPELRAAVSAHESAAALGCDSDLATLVEAWCTALERWLARYTELDLASLVQRRARVRASATHVDVCFEHDAADVRVRRPGLDIDPGWVAWLGRVVRFHYGRESWP
jgi:hypothetical protein